MAWHSRAFFGCVATASFSAYCYYKRGKPVYAANPISKPGPDISATQQWDYNWDMRDPKSLLNPPVTENNSSNEGKDEAVPESLLEPHRAKYSRYLYFIRHGDYNLEGLFDRNRSLTDLGRSQATATGKRLNLLRSNYTILISSTMTRALETADLIAKELPPGIPRQTDSLLEEGAPFQPEPPVSSLRTKEPYRFLTDGSRIEAAFCKFIHRADPKQEADSHEIIVCHANVIRYFMCRALQFPPEGWLRFSLAHGSITTIVIRPDGRVSLSAFGDSGHFPPDMVTSRYSGRPGASTPSSRASG